MYDKQEKLAEVDLVSIKIGQLIDQCFDLTDQINTLKARKQETGHLDQVVLVAISDLVSLKRVLARLVLELDMPNA